MGFYVEYFTEGASSFSDAMLDVLKDSNLNFEKATQLLKNRAFQDKLIEFAPGDKLIGPYQFEKRENVAINKIIGHCHGTYIGRNYWSRIFTNLRRPANLKILDNKCFYDDADFVSNGVDLLRYGSDFLIIQGMHRVVIAKFLGVKELLNVKVFSKS